MDGETGWAPLRELLEHVEVARVPADPSSASSSRPGCASYCGKITARRERRLAARARPCARVVHRDAARAWRRRRTRARPRRRMPRRRDALARVAAPRRTSGGPVDEVGPLGQVGERRRDAGPRRAQLDEAPPRPSPPRPQFGPPPRPARRAERLDVARRELTRHLRRGGPSTPLTTGLEPAIALGGHALSMGHESERRRSAPARRSGCVLHREWLAARPGGGRRARGARRPRCSPLCTARRGAAAAHLSNRQCRYIRYLGFVEVVWRPGVPWCPLAERSLRYPN